MTADQIEDVFKAAKPRAVDFPESEYKAMDSEIDAMARKHGYRLAGYRLGRAVFTSKPAGGSITR